MQEEGYAQGYCQVLTHGEHGYHDGRLETLKSGGGTSQARSGMMYVNKVKLTVVVTFLDPPLKTTSAEYGSIFSELPPSVQESAAPLTISRSARSSTLDFMSSAAMSGAALGLLPGFPVGLTELTMPL